MQDALKVCGRTVIIDIMDNNVLQLAITVCLYKKTNSGSLYIITANYALLSNIMGTSTNKRNY